MSNSKSSKHRLKIHVKKISKLAYFKGSLKGKKLPNDKDIELLFAQEAIGRNGN